MVCAIRAANDRIYWQRNRLTPAEPLQHHAHTLTCRHAGEFQIVAGENVPQVLDLQLLATSESTARFDYRAAAAPRRRRCELDESAPVALVATGNAVTMLRRNSTTSGPGSQRPNLLAAQSFDACRTTPASRAHAHVSTCRRIPSFSLATAADELVSVTVPILLMILSRTWHERKAAMINRQQRSCVVL